MGAGYFARFHVDAWKRLPEVELVAICDWELAKAQILANEFQIRKVYADVEALCAEETFDVVDIITPPNTHVALVEIFAHHGRHIICQKPLAPTLEDAQLIVQTAEKAGIRFMVHENFRFQPWYRKMKSLFSAGVIGDRLHTIHTKVRTGDGWADHAYLDRQPYFRSMPRLFMFETGIHYIDVFRYLVGDIHSVYARLRRLNDQIQGEDCGLVLVDFDHGGLGILDGNRYNESTAEDPRYTFGETSIECSGGTLRLYQDGKITIQELGKREQKVDYDHEAVGFAGDSVYFTQKHFVESFLNDHPFETDGETYLTNILIQECIYKSHESKLRVTIPQSA